MTEKEITEKYDFSSSEKYWQDFWQEEKIHQFVVDSQKPLYTIDTPPPTISGSLHLGHVYSYTQAEVLARFKRMTGYNVRYPIGFDNNGLPTERLVEKERNIKGENMDRDKFIKECLEVSEKYEAEYQALYNSLGFSMDWRLKFSTIEKRVQEISQGCFKKLFEQNIIYRQEFPVLYCTECKTSIAQAEVEDEEKAAIFYDLLFKTDDGQDLIIATTRPEFLPACVAVFIHPDDKRHSKLINKKVITPLGVIVPIIEDDKVDMNKGSGIVMCCTYGDDTDIYWVKKHKLKEIKLLKKSGHWADNTEVPEMAGKTIEEGREIIVNKLKQANKIITEKPINHNVGRHERCGAPIEFISTSQWFVKILDIKDELLALGSKVKWRPAYMEKRFADWIAGLKWDWCISRERFYGIPIPVFTCLTCQKVFVPSEDKLPVDPRLENKEIICPECNGNKLKPEKNVLDTWFTSSLTPEINNSHLDNGKFKDDLLPLSMRPQAHDIIRTWAFYSIVMSYYNHQQIPWEEMMISGHMLLRKGEKISKKTGGGKHKPSELISNHSADAVRYTTCGASLGMDAYFDEKELIKGKKLVNKLYNATKLVLLLLENEDVNLEGELFSVDRWIVGKSEEIAQRMREKLNNYEIGNARIIFEEFFWSDFCDNYLELAKARLFSVEKLEEGEMISTKTALVKTLLNTLKMVAIYTPHICEELYHSDLIKMDNKFLLDSQKNKGFFYRLINEKSIHSCPWPDKNIDLSLDLQNKANLLFKAIAGMRKVKTDNKIGLGSEVAKIIIHTQESDKGILKELSFDIGLMARAKEVVIKREDDLGDNLVIIL